MQRKGADTAEVVAGFVFLYMDYKKLKCEWEDNNFALGMFDCSSGIKNYKMLCEKAQEIAFEAIDAFTGFTEIFFEDEIIKMTPIEQIYYIAFYVYNFLTIKNRNKPFKFVCEHQKEILCNNHNYKVDFLFSELFFEKKLIKLKKPIIIECDGYDYHSTKKQRNYDIQRENDLKMNGYNIIRFTGSQIYNDPYLCILQTVKFIYDNNKEIEELIYGE